MGLLRSTLKPRMCTELTKLMFGLWIADSALVAHGGVAPIVEIVAKELETAMACKCSY